MAQEKSLWRKFNPSLKEMMERNPDYSVLGVWWSMTWRIFVVEAAIGACFFVIAILFVLTALFGNH